MKFLIKILRIQKNPGNQIETVFILICLSVTRVVLTGERSVPLSEILRLAFETCLYFVCREFALSINTSARHQSRRPGAKASGRDRFSTSGVRRWRRALRRARTRPAAPRSRCCCSTRAARAWRSRRSPTRPSSPCSPASCPSRTTPARPR